MSVGAPPDSSVERFNVWVWKPPYLTWRVRGLSNATLEISAGGFMIRARSFEEKLSAWHAVEYRWPAVVIETLIPLGGPGLLFEMSGKLARCAVQRDRRRLRPALNRAGLAIIEVKRWGWEAPHRVSADVLGGHASEVPSAVLA